MSPRPWSPEKIARECRKLGLAPPKTLEQIEKEFLAKRRALADAVPQPTRQKFLDAIWAGKTLGEARDHADIDFEAATQIVLDNIEKISHLRREAV